MINTAVNGSHGPHINCSARDKTNLRPPYQFLTLSFPESIMRYSDVYPPRKNLFRLYVARHRQKIVIFLHIFLCSSTSKIRFHPSFLWGPFNEQSAISPHRSCLLPFFHRRTRSTSSVKSAEDLYCIALGYSQPLTLTQEDCAMHSVASPPSPNCPE